MATVTMSSKGQVVIPRDVRERLGLRQGSTLAVEVAGGQVILRPVRAKRADWRRWQGSLRGAGVLEELVQEHRREVTGDAARRP